MSVTHVVGIDPGLVHTGVVELVFSSDHKSVHVTTEAVTGKDHAKQVKDFITRPVTDPDFWGGEQPAIFIEKYQPRSNLNTDAAMTKLLVELKQALPGSQVLLNTGVKKVVRKPLMELLKIWSFSTVTNHQDLRSAGRIAIYGMLKDEALNRLISDVVLAELKGRPWDVRH